MPKPPCAVADDSVPGIVWPGAGRRSAVLGSHSQLCRSSDTRNLLCAGKFAEHIGAIGNENTPGWLFCGSLKISKGFKARSRSRLASLPPAEVAAAPARRPV